MVGDEGEDHFEGVGSVIVVGFREVAELIDELRLASPETDSPVLDVRLHFGDAQDFIRIGADAFHRQVQSPLGALFNDPILEQFLKLDLLDPRQGEPVLLVEREQIFHRVPRPTPSKRVFKCSLVANAARPISPDKR